MPFLAAARLFFVLIPFVIAQTRLFEWGIPQVGTNFTLQECFTYNIRLDLTPQGSNPPPTPPFYIFASPPSGIPSVQLIGADSKSLSWTVPYPAGKRCLDFQPLTSYLFFVGTQLMLQTLDAN